MNNVPKLDVKDVLKMLKGAPHRARRQILARVVKPRYPRHLYKYRSVTTDPAAKFDALRMYLVESRLRLSSRRDFNDPFDVVAQVSAEAEPDQMKAHFRKMLLANDPKQSEKEREARVAHMMGLPLESWKKTAEESFNGQADKVGIFSLSIKPRDILMWSHYGDNHTGVCVQFEVAGDPLTFLYALPVRYKEQFPKLNWMGPNVADQLTDALLQKHPGWIYEAERRIVLPNAAHAFISFQPAALTRIVLGARIDDARRAALDALLKERATHGFPPVELMQARLGPDRYRLTLHKVA
ncbi:MAG TPA: DUF2971 domain-containing protein [Verrucomicrobiae bacterium]|nr:DUF2971 domain-containing protein [Verrucomicrobiae bacterium]